MFKIEKNVPLPAAVNSTVFYPFDQMDKGDSFYVPFGSIEPAIVKRRIANIISNINFRNSTPSADGETKINSKGQTVPLMVPVKKFTYKSNVEGIRVWRIL